MEYLVVTKKLQTNFTELKSKKGGKLDSFCPV